MQLRYDVVYIQRLKQKSPNKIKYCFPYTNLLSILIIVVSEGKQHSNNKMQTLMF